MEYGSSGQTRPRRLALRVLIGFVVLYAAIYLVRLVMGVGPNLLMRQMGASPDFRAFFGSTLNYGVGIVSYLIFSAIAVRKVLGLDPLPRLFPIRDGWWKHLLGGLVLVAAVLAAFFVVEVKMGWLVVAGWNWQALPAAAWLRVAWVGLLVNVGVAIGEETVFRGYLLTGLRSVWGKWPGLLVMTLIFGLFHLPAYIAAGFASASLTLAILLASAFGVLFGLAYLRTGSLWLPASLHFAWNFFENDVFNLTADSTNPNLVGAQTATGLDPTIVVAIESLAFCLIALEVGLWLRRGSARAADCH